MIGLVRLCRWRSAKRVAAAEGGSDEVLFSYAPQLPGCVEREGRITYGRWSRKGVLLSAP